MFTQIERELRQSIAEYENTDKMVDAVAFVANVFADIGQLAYKGIKRLAMSGYLLEEANREIGRDALKFAVKPPTELVSDHWSRLISSDDNLAIAFAKSLLFYERGPTHK